MCQSTTHYNRLFTMEFGSLVENSAWHGMYAVYDADSRIQSCFQWVIGTAQCVNIVARCFGVHVFQLYMTLIRVFRVAFSGSQGQQLCLCVHKRKSIVNRTTQRTMHQPEQVSDSVHTHEYNQSACVHMSNLFVCHLQWQPKTREYKLLHKYQLQQPKPTTH